MPQSSEPKLASTETTAPADSPIRVALIEDLREVREGLAALINGTRGFRCTGSYYSMEAALTGIGNVPPDVILTDIGLPGMSGIRGTEILRERFPHVPILALTVYDNDGQVFDALCAGASGYLLKNAEPQEIRRAIMDVHEKGYYLNNFVNRILLKKSHAKQKAIPSLNSEITLTDRERDVIKLFFGIGENHGLTLEEIGAKFDLTRERVRQIKDKAITKLRTGS